MGDVISVLNVASGARATYSSGLLPTNAYDALEIDINVTAITGGVLPTVSFVLSRQDLGNTLFPIYTSSSIGAPGKIWDTVGPGFHVPHMIGDQVQLDMVVTGGPTSVTFSASIKGK